MILAAQYYRPPFPGKRYWKQDLDKMKESGLNALQLWVLWSWVESEPGVFNFEDYDELFEEAGKRGLGIVLSTIAELHPLWIHRIIPDSHMIDNFGRKVISSNRVEAHQGLTPGGCTDHPEVLRRMRVFLEKVAERYKDRDNLLGWDCWNELRWNVQSDGLVCFCDHTLEAFRNWLRMKYNNLDGLNRAWNRRYCSWEDVFPGKLPRRPYTEMMEFEAFLQWRAKEHVKFRYETIKSVDQKHIITAHGPQPSYSMAGDAENHVMNRGNDFDLAEQLDGYGCSHFPFWFKMCDEDFGVRVESTRSAAAGKTVWVSELQGGSARYGFNVFPSVRAKPQQRWVWNGYGRGAKAVIFWCWRDEEFGKESSGYGLAGLDGYADERLEAMKETGELLSRYNDLLEGYTPDEAKVGVLFEPNSYNLEWAQEGASNRARDSITGYLTALERINVPYDMVESSHLEALEHLKVLIMPWPMIVLPEAAARITEFVKNGGTLLIEGEADAYTQTGFYRCPGEDREFAFGLGIEDLGRRVVKEGEFKLKLSGQEYRLKVDLPSKIQQSILSISFTTGGEYYTPLKVTHQHNSEILARDEEGNILAAKNRIGLGTVIVLANFIGKKYNVEAYPDFEKFIKHVVEASEGMHALRVRSEGLLQWRTGLSGKTRLLFVINPGERQKVEIYGLRDFFGNSTVVEDLRKNQKIDIVRNGNLKQFEFDIEAGDFAILKWEAEE